MPGSWPSDDAGRPPTIVLVGPLNVDLFLRGEAPLDREALDDWVGPSQVDLLVAGSIGYTAQALARLGADVELHSHVGDDAFAGHIRATLVDAGIDDGFVASVPGVTAIAVYMLLFGGRKRPMTYRLPDAQPWPDPPRLVRPGARTPDLVHSGGLLHFPGMWHRGLADSFAAARARGARTSIDPQFPLVDTPAPWLPHLEDVLAETDILLCDEGELRMIFDASDVDGGVAAAHALGLSIVVVKRGAAGAVISDGHRRVMQPAVPIPTELVTEAVGAGDAFDAGFLDVLMRGGQPAEAARFATACAALTLTARGGAEGIVSRDAALAAMPDVPDAVAWHG